MILQIRQIAPWFVLTLALLAGPLLHAAGTWTALENRAPAGIDTMLLLPDGTVIGADGNDGWYRLTPDQHGSYINGTWATLASMHDTRLYYASQVLTNGRMFIAGGEYGTGTSSGEIYDPLLNTWTMISPGAGQGYVDMISVVLPNSTILMAPVGPSRYGQTAIYNPEKDTWPLFPELVNSYNEDEASWVMLPDNSILTLDSFTTNSERFIPSLNKWINDTPAPVPLYDDMLGEIGPFFLLANSNVFCVGNTGYTALYTPSGNTNAGSWTVGPNEPNGLGAPDAPGAVLADGNVLITLGPSTNYIGPTSFFEYDPVANALVAVGGPGSFTNNDAPYVMRMLDLPDGGVLFSYSDSRLYEYQPTGAPLAAGQPAITSIVTNYYRSYHLTGTLLNGISQGAAYGDDAQMDSNYPLVRMTNASGVVYYARTYGWSSTVVMTGSLPVTTEFLVPQNLPSGTYQLVAVANGNSSAPVSFTFAQDTLQISALTGFGAVGPYGGPVSAQSKSYTLTNAGTTSLKWAVGNIPAWLSVSNVSGTLTNASNTTTVTISLNSLVAASEAVSNYNATVWFTNLSTGAIQGVPFSYQSTPLVVNGGFEYGSTAFWNLSDPSGGDGIVNNSQSGQVHSGFYAMFLGENFGQGPGSLSQTIPTYAGQRYGLSLWLQNMTGVTTNQFTVTWNGTNIYNQSNLGNFGYSNLQFTVVGASNTTLLEISYDNDTNYFGLDDVVLTSEAPPLIVVAPTNESVLLGGTAIFAVQAIGAPPLTYQWQFKGANLANATNTSLTLTNVMTNEGGLYTVIVSNIYGTTTSSPPALLTVIPPIPPSIAVPPANQTVSSGGTANFAVQAAGTPPFFYQWQFDGTNLAAATNSTLTLANVTSNQGGFYTVIVSNAYGITSSLPAVLIVLPPSIVQNGGFETGDLTDWTESGNTNFSSVVDDASYVHLGQYGFQAGPYGALGFISQTLATVPGENYLFSCWVNNPEGATPNDLVVTWNGNTLLTASNITASSWTNFQSFVLATSTNSILSIGLQDNPGYLGLDDISVALVPQPSFVTLTTSAGALVFKWSTQPGFLYQLQYTSDLESSHWTNLGSPVMADTTVTTATDTHTNAQRFYRIVLLP